MWPQNPCHTGVPKAEGTEMPPTHQKHKSVCPGLSVFEKFGFVYPMVFHISNGYQVYFRFFILATRNAQCFVCHASSVVSFCRVLHLQAL